MGSRPSEYQIEPELTGRESTYFYLIEDKKTLGRETEKIKTGCIVNVLSLHGLNSGVPQIFWKGGRNRTTTPA